MRIISDNSGDEGLYKVTTMDGCPQEIIDKTNLWLTEFRDDLEDAGLSEKTIHNHLVNAEMFARYVWNYDETSLEEGASSVGMFFGYWIVNKCLWATPSAIKSTGASIKKLFTSLAEHGTVSKEDAQRAKDRIKDGMPDWMEECRDDDAGMYGFWW